MNTVTKESALVAQACPAATFPERLHVWEVEPFFRRLLVGTCLSRVDQRRILQRSGSDVTGLSAFEVHELLVASMNTKCAISQRIDARLAGKYAKDAQDLLHMGVGDLKRLWHSAFPQKGWKKILWAVSVRPLLPHSFRRQVFGCVHMAMHGSLERSTDLEKKIRTLEKNMQRMQEKVSSQTALLNRLQRENASLREEHGLFQKSRERHGREMERLKQALAARKQDAPDQGEKHHELEKRMEHLSRCLHKERERNETLVRENEDLLDELDKQLELNERFQHHAREMVEQLARFDRCDKSCPSFDLCKKRILMVGGVTRIKTLYRQLIEEGGGVFEYHDGYMNKGAKDLERRFKQADMILCPVTCNSHGACSMVKKLGKKYNKPVHMLASSSLTALSRVIKGEQDSHMILN